MAVGAGAVVAGSALRTRWVAAYDAGRLASPGTANATAPNASGSASMLSSERLSVCCNREREKASRVPPAPRVEAARARDLLLVASTNARPRLPAESANARNALRVDKANLYAVLRVDMASTRQAAKPRERPRRSPARMVVASAAIQASASVTSFSAWPASSRARWAHAASSERGPVIILPRQAVAAWTGSDRCRLCPRTLANGCVVACEVGCAEACGADAFSGASSTDGSGVAGDASGAGAGCTGGAPRMLARNASTLRRDTLESGALAVPGLTGRSASSRGTAFVPDGSVTSSSASDRSDSTDALRGDDDDGSGDSAGRGSRKRGA